MISKLEDTLLRCNRTGSLFRNRLFECLDDGTSLRRLRKVSRVLHDLVDHHPGRTFRSLYVVALSSDMGRLGTFEIVAPFCHNLTITIYSEDGGASVTSPSDSRSKDKGGSLSWIKNGRTSWYSRRDSAQSPTASVLSTRASMSRDQRSAGRRAAQETEWQQWRSLFSRCHQMQRLTLRIHGDPAWPGRTATEDTLVNIRSALEYASPPNLRELHLTPIHAMGIIHLRFTSLAAFGLPPPRPAAPSPIIWSHLHTLDLQITNPFATLTPPQTTMFTKLLHSYLHALAPTLQTLRFIWLGNATGPSPMTLHTEPGLENRRALTWPSLSELWLGRIANPHRAIQLAPALAPKLERFMTLRCGNSKHNKNERVETEYPNAWVEVLLAKRRTSEEGDVDDEVASSRDGSSIYSRPSLRSSILAYDREMLGGVSRTSRVVPFMLDLTNNRRQ